MTALRISTKVKASTLLGVIAASFASMTVLLNQRQDMTIFPTTAMLVLAGVSIIGLKTNAVYRMFSAGSILLALAAIALISNLSYVIGEVKTPFENWARLLFPILLVPFSTILVIRSRENLKVFTAFFIALAIFASYKIHTVSEVLILLLSDSLQTNWGNALAAASPFIFFVRNRIVRNALLFAVILALIVSLKRTAFLSAGALVFSIFLAGGIAALKRPSFTLRGTGVLLIVLIGIAVAGSIVLRSGRINEYFDRAIGRVGNAVIDGGSGRTSIWADSIKIMDDSGIFRNLFGHGFSWFHDNGHRYGFLVESLHNDLIEFWISFGLVGVLVYIALLVRLAYLAVFVSRNHREHLAFAVSSMLIFFIYSIFSGVFFYYFFFAPLFVAIGILEAFSRVRTH